MPIKVGDKAPDFTLRNSEKELVTLKQYRGQNVVLLFFPSPVVPATRSFVSPRLRHACAGDPAT